MPELPEVEVVKESLLASLGLPKKISSIEFMRDNIRGRLPHEKRSLLKGQTILRIERRAKYILFETENYLLISHLGMTGHWRLGGELEKHDHVKITFFDGDELLFQDPRRFGVFDIISKEDLAGDSRFRHLGPEPFDKAFSAAYLYDLSRKKKAPVKNFIMDQRVVVGVGNIYAVEVLHMIGVSPMVQAGKIKLETYNALVKQVRKTLKQAIKKGGSSIKDFKQVEGKSGSFQDEFFVYGRKGEPCLKCGTSIKSKVIAGRNSFWCGKCQK